jgi:uncharacterized membrane protein YgdD (TMEM256/DUF423 family)
MMTRAFAVSGALFGLAAVLLGAFGAHALAAHIGAERIALWGTASDFLAWHAAALLGLAALTGRGQAPAHGRGLMDAAGGCLIAGTLIFSASLYLLALTDLRAFGAVTPIGGITLGVGWALAALGLWRLLAKRD